MPGYSRERLLSSFFDNVTFDQVCDVLDERVANRVPGYMMSLNLDIMIRADKDPDFVPPSRMPTLSSWIALPL